MDEDSKKAEIGSVSRQQMGLSEWLALVPVFPDVLRE